MSPSIAKIADKTVFRSVRSLALRPLEEALRVVVLLYLKAQGFRRYAAGRSAFYGPEDFLSKCQLAMHTLSCADPVIYGCVRRQRYVFWYGGAIRTVFGTHFSITREFAAWDDVGILAWVVYAHFKSTAFQGRILPLSNPAEGVYLNQEVRSRTHAWLLQKDFPDQILRCFTGEPDRRESSCSPR